LRFAVGIRGEIGSLAKLLNVPYRQKKQVKKPFFKPVEKGEMANGIDPKLNLPIN